MAVFNEVALQKKLSDLNPSQQSIETLSLWLIHHRKHHDVIVNVWYTEFSMAEDARKLTFLYLANDVIQNSKKKGSEFGKSFAFVLPKVFKHLSGLTLGEKTKNHINRLLTVWQDRGVFEKTILQVFRKSFDGEETDAPVEPAPKKQKVKVEVKKDKKNISETIKVEGKLETHVTLSPRSPVGEPPESEELIKALQALENTASADADVREKIYKLPPEVSNVRLLSKIEDRSQGKQLAKQVDAAVELLTNYNQRLSAELDDRKNLQKMLSDYIQSQKDLLAQAEERLEEYRDKLTKVNQVKQELRSHIQNLPDLTKLPDVTGGLAPLPSAGDLFSNR